MLNDLFPSPSEGPSETGRRSRRERYRLYLRPRYIIQLSRSRSLPHIPDRSGIWRIGVAHRGLSFHRDVFTSRHLAHCTSWCLYIAQEIEHSLLASRTSQFWPPTCLSPLPLLFFYFFLGLHSTLSLSLYRIFPSSFPCHAAQHIGS
jgi:hypothetical protein